jgi:hypothetical protein
MFTHIAVAAFAVALMTSNSYAQAQTPALPPEASQFDFWLGDWDATWGGNQRGVNRITKRWDVVVVEEFDGGDVSPLRGHSVSVFDAKSKQWKQTWVDNQGGYLDFTGGFADGRMTLSRSFEQDGRTVQQRMVWYGIQANEFEWNWERSTDGGKTWEVVWKIHYARRK